MTGWYPEGWNPEAFDRWLTTEPECQECTTCDETLGETDDCPECEQYRIESEKET